MSMVQVLSVPGIPTQAVRDKDVPYTSGEQKSDENRF